MAAAATATALDLTVVQYTVRQVRQRLAACRGTRCTADQPRRLEKRRASVSQVSHISVVLAGLKARRQRARQQ